MLTNPPSIMRINDLNPVLLVAANLTEELQSLAWLLCKGLQLLCEVGSNEQDRIQIIYSHNARRISQHSIYALHIIHSISIIVTTNQNSCPAAKQPNSSLNNLFFPRYNILYFSHSSF